MTYIVYQTDGWGDKEDDRLELDWPKGHTTFITISDKSITIHSDAFLKIVEPSALNKLVIKHGA